MIPKNPLVATLLYKTLDISALLASGAERAHALEDQFRKSWERDLKVLQEAIVSLIPEWSDASKNTILSNRPLVEKFLSMTSDSLQKVGCLVSEFRAHLRLIKKTSIVPSATVTPMGTFAQHTVETVVFQAVIECTHREWRSLESPVDCKRAVEQLKAKLKPKEVELPKEMSDCLAEWESGAKLGEPATQVPTEKKATAAMKVPTEEVPGKKRSLADRLKEAAEKRKQAKSS